MPYWAASSGPPRQPSLRSASGPPPQRVVCFVNRHRLITISSLVSSLVSSPVVAGHAHTRTLAHSHTAPSRQVHTHSHHLVPLKVTGEQPAQPLGLNLGHSGRSRASRTLRRLVSFSPACSPRRHITTAPLPLPRHRHTATAATAAAAAVTPPPAAAATSRRRRRQHLRRRRHRRLAAAQLQA